MQEMDYGRRGSTTQPPTRAARATGPVLGAPSVLDGLWVLLIANDDQLPTADADGRVPMMAKSGQTSYLLGFKTVVKARQFITSQGIEFAEPRMVVRGNRDELVRIAQSADATSVLIDYEPANQSYAGIAII
jgi:hypothetical protein